MNLYILCLFKQLKILLRILLFGHGDATKQNLSRIHSILLLVPLMSDVYAVSRKKNVKLLNLLGEEAFRARGASHPTGVITCRQNTKICKCGFIILRNGTNSKFLISPNLLLPRAGQMAWHSLQCNKTLITPKVRGKSPQWVYQGGERMGRLISSICSNSPAGVYGGKSLNSVNAVEGLPWLLWRLGSCKPSKNSLASPLTGWQRSGQCVCGGGGGSLGVTFL